MKQFGQIFGLFYSLQVQDLIKLIAYREFV